jgi:GDP-mannose 6-dehydrogenase
MNFNIFALDTSAQCCSHLLRGIATGRLVDIDQAKLDLIAAGKTPAVGKVQLMRDVVASGRVSVTRDTHDAVTPPTCPRVRRQGVAPNGSQNQSTMLRLAEDVAIALKHKRALHTIVLLVARPRYRRPHVRASVAFCGSVCGAMLLGERRCFCPV